MRRQASSKGETLVVDNGLILLEEGATTRRAAATLHPSNSIAPSSPTSASHAQPGGYIVLKFLMLVALVVFCGVYVYSTPALDIGAPLPRQAPPSVLPMASYTNWSEVPGITLPASMRKVDRDVKDVGVIEHGVSRPMQNHSTGMNTRKHACPAA